MDLKLVRTLETFNEDIFGAPTPEDIKQRADAVPQKPFEELITPGPVEIWYMKPETFGNLIMGSAWLEQKGLVPDPNNLQATHVLLGTTILQDPEKIFMKMQGEIWSPYGEARGVIKAKGLQHTSMSVGDIIVMPDGTTYMADIMGFRDIGKRGANNQSGDKNGL